MGGLARARIFENLIQNLPARKTDKNLRKFAALRSPQGATDARSHVHTVHKRSVYLSSQHLFIGDPRELTHFAVRVFSERSGPHSDLVNVTGGFRDGSMARFAGRGDRWDLADFRKSLQNLPVRCENKAVKICGHSRKNPGPPQREARATCELKKR